MPRKLRASTSICGPALRLVRCTICFSKTTIMYGPVVGLFINRYEFRRPI